MDNKIIPQIAQIRELKELQVYAQAQYNTILQLTKKLKKIEDEKIHLENLLKQSVPAIKSDSIEQGSDQELICKMEIQKFREISAIRELTLEEARKFQIYTQVLEKIPKQDFEEKQVKELNTDQLLQLVKPEKKDNGS